MVYGIDLGTTNSIIALRGELISELVPSIVSIDKKTAGKVLLDDMDSIRSFKRDMTIESEGHLAVLASSLVLRELLIQAKAKGHDVKDVVISVPAYFKDPQRQATKKAATQLGLNVMALINEPTAAAIALGQIQKGLSLVFDLGGGTFDISIVDSRFGNYDVIATDGVPKGGDDLDRAIMTHIIGETGITIHHLGSARLQQLLVDCEKLKRHIVATQSDGVLDLTSYPNRKELKSFTLTTRMYERIVRSTFKECIVKMKELIANYINTDLDEYELIFVGGSTKCPYLRKFAEDANGKPALTLSANPDTVIAEGASLYADMVLTGEDEFLVSDVTTALRLGLSDGTTEVLIAENSKLPATNKVMITNSEAGLEGILYDLYQGNSLLAKNNEQIGQLRYPLKKYYEKGKFRAWATIKVDRSGLIEIGIQEPLSEAVIVKINQTPKEVV